MADGVNPLAYILPAVALGVVVLWYAYGAADRLALPSTEADARVTNKNFTPGSTTYNTNIVAGRAWTQSVKNPDAYVVSLDIDGIATVGVVTQQMYQALNPGDRVRVKYSRTRFSNQLLVTDVSR